MRPVKSPNELPKKKDVNAVSPVEVALGDLGVGSDAAHFGRGRPDAQGGGAEGVGIIFIEVGEGQADAEGAFPLLGLKPVVKNAREGLQAEGEGFFVFRGADSHGDLGAMFYVLAGGVAHGVVGLVAKGKACGDGELGLFFKGGARGFFGGGGAFAEGSHALKLESLVDGKDQELLRGASEHCAFVFGGVFPPAPRGSVDARGIDEDALGANGASDFDKLRVGGALEERVEEGSVGFSGGSGEDFKAMNGVVLGHGTDVTLR